MSHTTGDHRSPSREPVFRLWQARSALVWERLMPALWMALSVLGAFLAAAFFNVLPVLPGWLHLAVLALFATAFATALWAGFRRFRLPDTADARRRLERDSGLPHRPLHTLRDRMTGGDPVSAALWALHQERTRAAMRRLRVRLPQPNLVVHDRYAVRALVGLVLVVAGVTAYGDWRPRLLAAVSPGFAGPALAPAATLDLWVTPPEYTGLPPIFLKAGAESAAQAVAVPKGSQVLGRVTGGKGTPSLEVNGRTLPFESVDGGSHQIAAPVDGGTRIAVNQNGGSLGAWPVVVVPDKPPTIGHVAPPAAAERGTLRLEYAAQDDYGLAALGATIRLAPPPAVTAPAATPPAATPPTGTPPTGNPEEAAPAAAPVDTPPLDLPLGLPGGRVKEARSVSFQDLTAHPWAGLPVTIALTATDGAGQTGHSDALPLILPERVFNHPVARAIIEQRKALTLRPTESRTEVARALSELSARPGAFQGDLVAFLALRTAVARLMLNEEADTVPALQQLLWETALRIEDGGLSVAERDLRNAEQRLADALERGAPDEELRKLMDELQAALDAFMNALEEQMRQALERGEQLPQVPPELADRMNTFDRNDLQRMMDQMRNMAETGARDAARQMLSQLQQMMENLRSGQMAQQQGQQQNQAYQMMQELQSLAQRQQELLDQSFRQSQDQMGNPGQQQQGQQGPRGRQQQGQQGQRGQQPGNNQQLAQQQEALRRQLGELMRRMGEMGGEIPRPLGRAERAMRDAGQALQRGQPGQAVGPQTQAMDELQQGLQGMAEQMMQQMMGMQPGPGMQPGGQPGQPDSRQVGRGRDPLGRRPPGYGQFDNQDVKIPEEAELQRAREILDELRRRSGEQNRPRQEREYIDRLLRQF